MSSYAYLPMLTHLVCHHTLTYQFSAWILCNTVGRINGVLDMYKSRFCPGGSYEQDKTVRLIQGKTRDTGCDWTKQKWCWPLAQIEEESPTPDMSLPPNGGF